MSEPKYFTLVFKGDITDFLGNPLKTETPFGIPEVCGIGNAFDRVDELEAKLAEIEDDLWNRGAEMDLLT